MSEAKPCPCRSIRTDGKRCGEPGVVCGPCALDLDRVHGAREPDIDDLTHYMQATARMRERAERAESEREALRAALATATTTEIALRTELAEARAEVELLRAALRKCVEVLEQTVAVLPRPEGSLYRVSLHAAVVDALDSAKHGKGIARRTRGGICDCEEAEGSGVLGCGLGCKCRCHVLDGEVAELRAERDSYRAQVDGLLRRLSEAQRCEHAEPPGRVEP